MKRLQVKNMKPSPLQLTEYFLTDLHFSANNEFDPAKDVPLKADHFQVGVEAQPNKDDRRRWQIILKLQHQPAVDANVPYRFTVEIIGFFLVLPNFPEERIQRLVRTNGASMLYGAVREIVRDMTTRGPYLGVMLPSASFFEPEVSAAPEKPIEHEK